MIMYWSDGMDKQFNYDQTDRESIYRFALGLRGRTFRESFKLHGFTDIQIDKNNKGGMNTKVETFWFGYAANSRSEADFKEAELELKVTPFKEINNGKDISAKERLVLTMIDYFGIATEEERDLLHSHVWEKCNNMLIIYYLDNGDKKSKVDCTPKYFTLFTPPEKDLEIMKADYQKIRNLVLTGHAEKLSESQTLYLGACTKGRDSRDLTSQPFSEVKAMRRAFCLKTKYMTQLLREQIAPEAEKYESILKDGSHVSDFESYVNKSIGRFKGWSVPALKERFGIKNNPKQLCSLLAYRILGIKGNHAEEFEKAGVEVRSIRIENNGKIKESQSFKAFKAMDLINEEWYDSELRNYLAETIFFFVVYKRNANGTLYLVGSQFWSVPNDVLDGPIRDTWEETVRCIKEGVRFEFTNNGIRNNLPGMTFNHICHVRPHTTRAAYRLGDYEYGDIDRDGDMLPNHDYMTKQSFWLDSKYILSILREDLK